MRLRKAASAPFWPDCTFTSETGSVASGIVRTSANGGMGDLSAVFWHVGTMSQDTTRANGHYEPRHYTRQLMYG